MIRGFLFGTVLGDTIDRYHAWRSLSPFRLLLWTIGKVIMFTLVFGVLTILLVEAFNPGTVTAVLQGGENPVSLIPLALASRLPLAGIAAFAAFVTIFPPTGEHADSEGESDLF